MPPNIPSNIFIYQRGWVGVTGEVTLTFRTYHKAEVSALLQYIERKNEAIGELSLTDANFPEAR